MGGKGSNGNRLVTKSELSTYGCKLVSNPSKSYANNQCVAERDIEKAFTPLAIDVYTVESRAVSYARLSSPRACGTDISVTCMFECDSDDITVTMHIECASSSDSMTSPEVSLGNPSEVGAISACNFNSFSPATFTYNGTSYRVVNGTWYDI